MTMWWPMLTGLLFGTLAGVWYRVAGRRRGCGHDLELAQLRARVQEAEAARARCVCRTTEHPHRSAPPPMWIDVKLPHIGTVERGGRLYAVKEPRPRPAPTSVPGPGKARLD